MKMTVIGYWGGYPAAGEATSGYLIEHEGFSLLVDCGSAVLSQLQKFIQIDQLDAVLLSHYHHDHIADIGPLQYALLIHRFMGKELKELPIYGHSHDQIEFDRLSYKNISRGIAYNPEKKLHIGPFSVTFMQTVHPVMCYAMEIQAGDQSIVYTADSSFDNKFISFAQQADLFICESNLYANQNGTNAGHMTSEEAGFIANKGNVKELLLTHLPHFGDHEQLIREAEKLYQGNVTLAKTGYVWG
ncbi:MBL fold metallo-hydrolase [Cytobacillus sp. IB215665]|uniref:MBL fold metallo-hydrolase n=1 Tax=Cytobacillus sp. IB215665 TaxID=3097357 RepID=UPI002A16010D|nr:MBL fold metallo-hydrolase [Cytobacillus sp. IB215665]MDX8364600.1 MBL fold metallo-hydrolase [Cytobacillus sp. IB215665]